MNAGTIRCPGRPPTSCRGRVVTAANTSHFADGQSSTTEIVNRAAVGDALAEAYLRCVEDRLARALTTIINVLNPKIIMLGGGVSTLRGCTTRCRLLLPKYVFSEIVETKIALNVHGDSGGVRGPA